MRISSFAIYHDATRYILSNTIEVIIGILLVVLTES